MVEYQEQHRCQILIGEQRSHYQRIPANNVASSMVIHLVANQDLTPMLSRTA